MSNGVGFVMPINNYDKMNDKTWKNYIAYEEVKYKYCLCKICLSKKIQRKDCKCTLCNLCGIHINKGHMVEEGITHNGKVYCKYCYEHI